MDQNHFLEAIIAQCDSINKHLFQNALLLNQRVSHIHRDLSTIRLLSTISKTQPPMPRDVHIISKHRTSTETLQPKIGFFARILKKTGILDVQKYVIKSFSLPFNLEW